MASHFGSDFSTVKDRVERYGSWTGKLAEGIMFGKKRGPQYIYSLYVDDGIVTRGDRKNMVNAEFKWTGIAHCEHAERDEMMVVVYASEMGKGSS